MLLVYSQIRLQQKTIERKLDGLIKLGFKMEHFQLSSRDLL